VGLRGLGPHVIQKFQGAKAPKLKHRFQQQTEEQVGSRPLTWEVHFEPPPPTGPDFAYAQIAPQKVDNSKIHKEGRSQSIELGSNERNQRKHRHQEAQRLGVSFESLSQFCMRPKSFVFNRASQNQLHFGKTIGSEKHNRANSHEHMEYTWTATDLRVHLRRFFLLG
jgi:hypothetical protein